MNRFGFIILASFLAATYGQCPPNNCPPPVFPQVPCGVPDCSITQNRYRSDALFPHPDPNYFWQCSPLNATHWAAEARPCGCGTVFNPNENPPRCTFWYDRSWAPICNWANPPVVKECPVWCPDCDGDGNVPGPSPPGPSPPGPSPNPPDDDNNCPCQCPPCIWWPCVPCNPTNNCSCNSNRNRVG